MTDKVRVEGYGYDWTGWDHAVRDRFKNQLERLGKYKYRNFEVFKSPKGRWMAFHNESYTDIKVVDLETLDVVATNFYSNAVYSDGKYNREKSTYASHTNSSTFVPTYIPHKSDDCTDYETVVSLGLNQDLDWDSLISAPVAFNAWTVWAADFEFYVDVLDLSKIDEGVIKKWDKVTRFVIPIEASHVRNFVKFDMTFWLDMKPKNEEGVSTYAGSNSAQRGEYNIDFTVLEERTRDRFSLNLRNGINEFYDMHKDGKEEYQTEKYLPWQETQRRIEEYKKRETKND